MEFFLLPRDEASLMLFACQMLSKRYILIYFLILSQPIRKQLKLMKCFTGELGSALCLQPCGLLQK